jgi:hypothetical protein
MEKNKSKWYLDEKASTSALKASLMWVLMLVLMMLMMLMLVLVLNWVKLSNS